MRRTILLNLFFVLLIAVAAHQACAQRNGGSGQEQHGQGFAGGAHNFSGGNHGFRGNRGDRDSDHDRGRHDFHHNGGGLPYGWGYPYGYGYGYLPPYDDGYMADESNNYEPAPSANDQQPAQPVQPVPPPVAEKPTHPVVKEYKWPATGTPSTSASSTSSDSEPPAIAIVLKNGSTLSATMVLASANSLHYVDTEGKLQHIDIAEVDRAATLKLDRARNLNIYLPAAQ